MNRGVLAGLGPGDSPDVVSGDAGQNANVMAPNRKEVTFSTTAAAAVALTDCSNYRSVTIQLTSAGASAAHVPQQSNDGVTWLSMPVQAANQNISSLGFQVSVGNIYYGYVQARYFRINVTGITSGTSAGIIEFSSLPVGTFTPQVPSTITVQGTSSPQDATTGTLPMQPQLYTGTFLFDRQRTCNIFKTVTATAAGDTAIWTPTTGKKFRLMRARIEVTNDASITSGAELDIILRDATTSTSIATSLYVPAAGGTALGAFSTGTIPVDNGILSAAANNVLNVNLSSALATGKVRVSVAGIEE